MSWALKRSVEAFHVNSSLPPKATELIMGL